MSDVDTKATDLVEICCDTSQNVSTWPWSQRKERVMDYLYPFFQHALVKGPLVHAVSLSTSPMSVEGSTAASAKGARPNRQRRLNMEAIAKATKS
jgi:hypothetical protein